MFLIEEWKNRQCGLTYWKKIHAESEKKMSDWQLGSEIADALTWF